MNISNAIFRAVGAISLYAAIAAPASALQPGAEAIPFSGTTLTGEKIELNDFLGKKPIYLKFWATWCSYCKRELPHAQSIFNEFGDEVEVVMVNVGINDSVENINQLYGDRNISLPTIIDESGEIVAAYGVMGTPNHILIDAEGRVVYRSFLATDELDARIEAAASKTIEEVAQ
ncbi:TlpA disulfide reductase family protein [Gilvimarinus sp. SDUM040013]|uniref:TlpA disulfide reductase family protein n=1 Tax=Gilvimarinus gilvus TaxID=3058038 RepID=A0ABU4S365_9GAMM|nr:TlpA disulfide reductase family protein [Gilvimarinus sp. SDUM040013]MDO3384652.1 TlpA disulfide reductase family protein [Gilvimarinus sp. SDUM040013]MDX6850238.1 TlpA disulfide reductase family protein [Gilvimarinus sp. SDUM040013]